MGTRVGLETFNKYFVPAVSPASEIELAAPVVAKVALFNRAASTGLLAG